MAVALTTLHLELVTQQHYVEGYREADGALDPFLEQFSQAGHGRVVSQVGALS